MNNLNKKYKFGSTKSQMKSILRNMTKDLILHEHVTTTKARAKAVKIYAEKLIARSKDNSDGKRYVESMLGTKGEVLTKLTEELHPRYKDVNSGFIESYKIGFRKGDGAEVIRLSLKGYTPEVKTKLKKVKNSSKVENKKANKKAKTKPVANTKTMNKSDNVKSQVKVTDLKSKAASRAGTK